MRNTRRRRPEHALTLELRRALGKAPTEQLELAPPAAQAAMPAGAGAFAVEAPCSSCDRRGYHLKSCPRRNG